MAGFVTWGGPGRPAHHRRTPRPWTPPPEQPTAHTRRRISTSDGDFEVDADSRIVRQLPDSRSPVYERIVAAEAEPEEPEA